MSNRTYNKIYNNFLGGLTPLALNIGREGSYAEARDVDPHRSLGFIRPGWTQGGLTSSTGGNLAGLITDACFNPDNSANAYAISTGHLYKLTNTAGTFVIANGFPHSGLVGGSEVFFYHIQAARRLFYIQSTNMGMAIVGIGNFDDDWLSTIPAGADNLQTAPHPKIEWKSYMFIGNGRYVAKLDGQTGANGTFEAEKLDLGEGWEVTALFSTKNFLGICAWKKIHQNFGTECKIFMWDGTSSTFTYYIPVDDNYIQAAFNDGGTVYLLTTGKSFGHTLRVLTGEGEEPLESLKTYVNGELGQFSVSYPNVMDMYNNRLLIGTWGGEAVGTLDYRGYIFAYGSTHRMFPKVLTQPYSATDDVASGTYRTGFCKQLYINKVFHSSYDGTNYYWRSFQSGNSTNALYKGLYHDLGQRIRINYVKFYFKPLVSGDDIAVSIDTNYGTVNSLGTLNYSTDGAITSKIFRKPLECHSFRPVLDWTAGETAISKIVVNYQFISD